MTARIKNLNTDFTRFLGEKIRHTVKIVTNTETLECSGAVISQHSEVMKKMVENDEEIFLNNYEFAKECLTILHGGSVELTEENCEEIIKFGIQFGLTDITEQGLEHLASNTDENNLKSSAEVCYNASKFAESCKLDANIDYSWPLEGIVNKLSTTAIDEFVTDINSTVGTKVILEMIKNRILAKKLLNSFISLIDQSNIDEILATFLYYESHDIYAEAFSDCPENEISSFFGKIEALELQKEQLRSFQNLKKCMLRESEANGLKLKPNKEDLLTSWKRFSEEKIVQVCKVFETDFYILEVIMSWVALNRPDLKTFRRLCSLVNSSKLEKEYLEHAIQVFKAEGYVVSFDVENCESKTENNLDTSKHVDGLTLTYGSSLDVTSRTVSANYTDTRYHVQRGRRESVTLTYTITISNNMITWQGSVPKNCTKMYGRTEDGKQIPFYTDVQAALKADTVYDVKTLRSF